MTQWSNRPPGATDRGGRNASSWTRRRGVAHVAPGGSRRKAQPDFAAISATALAHFPALCARWLPDGRREGREWVALNPLRADRHAGSFKVNMETGRWADFALPDARGRDPISLAAYLFDLSQVEAARNLAQMLGVES